ncbi:MAG: fructosamine kinase family protein, partial [Oscillospiraceae bacterium]
VADKIADNLISLHSAKNPSGFGPLGADTYFASWQDYYFNIAKKVVIKAKALTKKGQLTEEILSVFRRSIDCFAGIFDIPITEACLIHGDYSTRNILLNDRRTDVAAVIDPHNCCWADSEFDLYQLDSANGRELGLLERYSEKKALSPNFESKRRFYELYTEVDRYFNSGANVNLTAVGGLAERLLEILPKDR